MRTTRLTRALTTTLVVATTAAGCAAGGEATQADRTPAATTAAPQPTATTAEALTPDTLVTTLSDVMLAARSLTWTTSTNGASGPTANVVDVDLVNSNNRVRVTVPEGSVEVRSVDGRRFVKAPGTKGKFYDDTLGTSGLAQPSVGVDPVRPLRALYGAVIAVRPAGTPADVNGTSAQPYEVVVATSRLTDGLGDLAGGVAADQLPPTVTLTFWVDQENRLLLAQSNVAGTPVEMAYTNWGADLGITAPAEQELTNVLAGA
ncbi:hypothetical protein Cch01nite_20940 [Cellulomonas chitinilytica]|uniref:Lipoprotein n=1 Tax=Cellulomonas chitinilytica TaxID=398759 RepID=A0A919P2B0_9CELL|nr:hypothetical protein [Cellulomonas chitinilytica]GIG21370.1 hypothetical protein Cch01nite_20940 [Cellulomonas chitinilytica]